MILAIDPSLSGTAIVRGDLSAFEVKRFTSEPTNTYIRARVQRYEKYVAEMMAWIGPGPFDAIFIEGYAFSKNDAGARWVTEYRSILHWHIVDLIDPKKTPWEVHPQLLKIFAAAKGNADKPLVAKCLREKYDVDFGSFDEYDAFGIFRLGLCIQKLVEPDGRGQVYAVEEVRNPRPKNKKVRKAREPKPSERTLF